MGDPSHKPWFFQYFNGGISEFGIILSFFKHSSATKKTGIWDDSQDNHKVVPPKVTKMAYNPILLVRYITNKNP
jgi:hypothetical protein